MTHKLTLLVILPIVAGLVTACGGGGGGSGPMQLAHSAQPPETVETKTSTISGTDGKGHFFLAPKSRSGKWSVEDRTRKSGVSIRVPDGTSSTSYYENDAGALASIKTTSAGPLYHSQYGLMVLDDNSHVVVGGYHAGDLTPKSQMPSDASATYHGSFGGYGGTTGGSAEGLVGDVRLRANFGAGTVNGQVSNLQNTDGASKSYGLSMNGKISGNTYSGTSGFTTKSGAASGRVTSSAMTGGFYGPNARETAGAMRVEGTPGPTKRPVAIVGGFGAKRQ